MSTKSQKAHDKYILDLAHAVAYVFRNVDATAIQNLATKWQSDWEELQGKEYIDDADIDWCEKRIHILLELLVSCRNDREAKSLLKTLAQNLDSYSQIVAHCPSGFFSKDIDERTSAILSGTILL